MILYFSLLNFCYPTCFRLKLHYAQIKIFTPNLLHRWNYCNLILEILWYLLCDLDKFFITRFTPWPLLAVSFLGNLRKLASINVALPHLALICSAPRLKPAAQQRSFAYKAETILTVPMSTIMLFRSNIFPVPLHWDHFKKYFKVNSHLKF